MLRRIFLIAAVAASAALSLSACSAAAPTAAPTPTTSTGAPLEGELTVFAAASLGTAFDEMAAAFERANPGVDVRPIVYDGSSTLATQLTEGARADVFASADEKNLARVTDAGLAPAGIVF